MPVQRCALADIELVVADLERNNKIVTQLAITGGAVVVLFHAKLGRPRGGSSASARETRGATTR